MDSKTYLSHYRLCIDRFGIPIVIRQCADEVTLKGEELESGEPVAVQVQPTMTFTEAEREQLQAEARAARQIDHPNIPRLRDFGFDEGQLVYVTDYFEGISADAWLKTNGAMPLPSVLRLAAQVVSALVVATLHGVIHYAVNPANIMLVPVAAGEWPRVKLLNFLGVAPSLAYLNDSGLNAADFTSPEQLHEGPVTFRSEIYSLGCTLWYLLKRQPIKAGAALDDATDLPPPVRQLLASMLAEDPADRPGDPHLLQQQIQDCLTRIERHEAPAKNETISAPVLANFLEAAPRRHSAWKPLALAAILIGIAAVSAVVVAQRTHSTVAGFAPLSKPHPSAPPQIVEPSPLQNATDETAELVASASFAEPAQTEEENYSLGEIAANDGGAAALPVADDDVASANVPADIEATTESSPAASASETALAQLSLTQEAPPPAEGPGEVMMAAVSPAPEIVTPDAVMPNLSLIALPASTPAKPARTIAAKKSEPEEDSSDDEDATPHAKARARLVVRHQTGRNSVGHILFPKPNEEASRPAVSASTR